MNRYLGLHTGSYILLFLKVQQPGKGSNKSVSLEMFVGCLVGALFTVLTIGYCLYRLRQSRNRSSRNSLVRTKESKEHSIDTRSCIQDDGIEDWAHLEIIKLKCLDCF